jgi:midasin
VSPIYSTSESSFEIIFSVFSALLSHPYLARGPLGFLEDTPSLGSVDALKLHRVLLAYYRILHANEDLPRLRSWPLEFLSRIIWERHPDAGVRFLAIRCYALQSGMMEGERVKMEEEAVGSVETEECPVFWDAAIDGGRPVVDGWILPMKESKRIADARQALLAPQKYYTYEEGDSVEPIHPAELRSVLPSFTMNILHWLTEDVAP